MRLGQAPALSQSELSICKLVEHLMIGLNTTCEKFGSGTSVHTSKRIDRFFSTLKLLLVKSETVYIVHGEDLEKAGLENLLHQLGVAVEKANLVLIQIENHIDLH